jgi:hypothetical protein
MVSNVRRYWWLVGAGVWSVALLVVAVVVPLYGSTSTRFVAPATPSAPAIASASASATVAVRTAHDTLVHGNGFKVLAPLSFPLVAVVAVAVLLPAHRRLAWAITALVLGLCLLAMLTVGVFLLPAAILLVVACSLPAPATR